VNGERLAATPTITRLNVNKAKGTVVLATEVKDKVSFGGLLGLKSMTLKATAETKGAAETLEVALVLDNSGSMDEGTRIEDLRAASAKFIEVLHEDEIVRKKVSVAVVPFSSSVNVGSEHLNASWIDSGTSSIHAENLNTYGDSGAPSTRQQVYALLQAGYKWKGCVETRTGGMDVTDAPPQAGNPQSLFTPMFAPDEPDNWYYQHHASWPYANSYLEDDGLDVKVGREKRDCTHQKNLSNGQHEWKCTRTFCNLSNQCTTYPNELRMAKTNPNHSYRDAFSGQCAPPAGKQGRVWNQSNTCKYKGGGKKPETYASPVYAGYGPNFMCDSEPILPLTSLQKDKDDLIDKVEDLPALGGTNILEGLMWGWRVLSDSAPFTQGKSGGDNDNRKIMVVMTDGQNTLYSQKEDGETLSQAMNKTWYSTFGFGSRGRLKVPTQDDSIGSPNEELMTAMDGRLALACENAKTAGITVYTVILTSSAPGEKTDWSAAKKLMRGCASAPAQDFAYAPTKSSELDTVFTEIARSIRKIHLAR
jgi:hypothetical protein